MARTTKPLSDTEIKQAKPKDREYNLADGNGLYLRVKPNGTKLWLFNYSRPYTRKRANLSFGQYPALSLAQARLKRHENLELLAQNIDPLTYRKDQKRQNADKLGNSLEVVAKKWLQLKRSKISEQHADSILRSLELHLFPRLGPVPIESLRAHQAIEVLGPLAARGALETVKRLCQRLNQIMVYSVNTGLITANNLAGIGEAFESPDKIHMPTLKPQQLPFLMAKLNAASVRLSTRCLIEWQLHTMTRPSEAAGTQWSEIDLERALWMIPADRMKKKRPHTIPLSSQAINLLKVMKPISGHREYVFPAERNPRTHIHQQTANMALKRMGFGGQLVAHGMRSLASTILNEMGHDPEVIEAALAHTDKNEVRSAYNRAEYLERRKVLMQWWSEHIERSAEGNLSLSGSKHLKVVGH